MSKHIVAWRWVGMDTFESCISCRSGSSGFGLICFLSNCGYSLNVCLYYWASFIDYECLLYFGFQDVLEAFWHPPFLKHFGMKRCSFDVLVSVGHVILKLIQLICCIGFYSLILFPFGSSIAGRYQFCGIGPISCPSCGFQTIWLSYDQSAWNSGNYLPTSASCTLSSGTYLINSKHTAYARPSQALAWPPQPAHQETASSPSDHAQPPSNSWYSSPGFYSICD